MASEGRESADFSVHPNTTSAAPTDQCLLEEEDD